MDIIELSKQQGGTGKATCHVIARIATRAGCSPGTLYLIGLGHKQASALLARKIEEATDGAVTRYELRPDVFGPAPDENEQKAA